MKKFLFTKKTFLGHTDLVAGKTGLSCKVFDNIGLTAAIGATS